MNKWIIPVTGLLMMGACSIKRRAESTQSASSGRITQEARSLLHRDSVEAALNRSLQIDRRWMVDLPGTGRRIRYDEHIRFGETAQSSGSTLQQESVESVRGEHTEKHVHRIIDEAAETTAMEWWLWLLIGIAAWLAWRFLRVWPFK